MNDTHWDLMVDGVATLFNLDECTKDYISHDMLFKLAGTLPYLAESPEWEREGMSNLILITAISIPGIPKLLFAHNNQDDENILHRLQIFRHPAGDQDIQTRGISLMAIVMLNDYFNDQTMDERKGKYNPLTSGVWNYAQQKARLSAIVENTPCPAMDEVFPLTAASNRDFWFPS